MRAAVFQGAGEPLEIEEVDRPEPDPDGVVIETDACGVCRSDWHAWQGDWGWLGIDVKQGQILGHEPAGTVVEVGEEVDTLSEGDRIAAPFNLADGTCPMCRHGHSNVCENGLAFGFSEDAPGAFAEEVHVPNADFNAAVLPEGVSSIDMAGLGCRFMTAFHALAHRADVNPGDWVAIHGCGGVGLSAVHVADALGANVVAVDLFDEKLEMAEELGADEVINAEETDDVTGMVHLVTDGGASVSVDALGHQETAQNSIMSLNQLGQHVQVGMTGEDEQGMISVPSDMMAMTEIEFIGSKGMQVTRYDEIFRMVERDKLDPGRVVSEHITLGDVPETLESMSDFGTMGIPVCNDFTA